MSENSDVLVERKGDIAIIRMNRPEVSNAVGPMTMQRLCSALDETMTDPAVKAIVLSHTGKHFIAGADFAFLEDLSRGDAIDARNDIYTWFQGAAKRLHLCEKPTVAAIGGAAVTVGCELAIACDFRIVTAKAVFQESWIKLGLIAPLGGLKLLPVMIGWNRAKEMMLMARAIKGEEAVQINLASELVDEDQREPRAIALAMELAGLAPNAYRAAKEGLWRGLQSSFEDSWATNLLAQSMLIDSDDFREAFSAIKENRQPKFKGR